MSKRELQTRVGSKEKHFYKYFSPYCYGKGQQ